MVTRRASARRWVRGVLSRRSQLIRGVRSHGSGQMNTQRRQAFDREIALVEISLPLGSWSALFST